MFVDFNFANNAVYFRAGKQVLQWGTGYFWNPTDLINISHKSFTNLNALLDGVFGLRADVTFSQAFHLYTFINLNDVSDLTYTAYAARAEFLAGMVEFGFSGWYEYNKIPVFGADITMPLFWELNLTGEASLSYGDNVQKYDPVDRLPTRSATSWFPRWTSACRAHSTCWTCRTGSPSWRSSSGTPTGTTRTCSSPSSGSLLPIFDSTYYHAGYYGQYYGAFFVTINDFGLTNMSLSLNGLSNFSDGSAIALIGLSDSPVSNFTLTAAGRLVPGQQQRGSTPLRLNPITELSHEQHVPRHFQRAGQFLSCQRRRWRSLPAGKYRLRQGRGGMRENRLRILGSPGAPGPLRWVSAFRSARAEDWLQFNRDPGHSGNNTAEKLIGPQSVARLTVLFRVRLPDVADGAAAYVSGVHTPRGPRDVLFLTTRDGHIVARDALNGESLWERSNPANGLTINNAGTPCYTTASPAVDPDRRFVFSYGLDGYVHKYRTGDGEEVKGAGWPELTTLKPWDEKGSSNLSIATDRQGTVRLYVTHSGYYGDFGNYQGHLTTINLADGSQDVFNANCSDRSAHLAPPPQSPGCSSLQTGIWGRAGIAYDADLDRIYTATGNGPFAPDRYDWGDTVLALAPDGRAAGGRPLDSYTPEDFQYLNDADIDLGSTIPAILPAVRGSSVPHLGIQAGKDALLRLLDLADLSGHGSPGGLRGELATLRVPQGGQVLTAPAVWTDPGDGSCWAFVSTSRGISGVQIVAGQGGAPRMIPRWVLREGGTSPVIAWQCAFLCGIRAHSRFGPAQRPRALGELGDREDPLGEPDRCQRAAVRDG